MRFISTVGDGAKGQASVVVASDDATGRALLPELQGAGMRARCVLHDRLEHTIAMDAPEVVIAFGPRSIDACTIVRTRRSRPRVIAVVADEEAVLSALRAGADHAAASPRPEDLLARIPWLVEAVRIERAMWSKFDGIRMWQDWVRYLIHDLRQPLTAAMSFVSLARLHARDNMQILEDLAPVDTAHVEMRQMLQDLLDTDRIRHGALTLVKQQLDVAELARQAAARISYKVDVVQDGDTTLEADRALLGRVFGNLLMNASRHAHEQPIRVAITGGPHGVSAAVVNDGPEIPKELLPHLFDPWHAQGSERATGIGLAFCRLVCEAHAGSIWVESASAGNVSFAFGIPRVPS